MTLRLIYMKMQARVKTQLASTRKWLAVCLRRALPRLRLVAKWMIRCLRNLNATLVEQVSSQRINSVANAGMNWDETVWRVVQSCALLTDFVPNVESSGVEG